MNPIKKITRHETIRRIIENEIIGTQEELVKRLEEEGCPVTQATCSRDIRELRLMKMTTDSGDIRYIIPDNNGAWVDSGKYVRILSDAFVKMDTAENIIVIKTVSGMAMAAAAALDSLRIAGIVGCIAGDDTIMCAIKQKAEVVKVTNAINKLLMQKQ